MLRQKNIFHAMTLSWCLLLLTLLTSFAANASQPKQNTGWIKDPTHPPVQLRMMLTGEQNTAENKVESVLEVQLDSDWKTYWRSPGEGGVAPKLDWSESQNIADVQWHWPAPNYYQLLGVTTLGYQSSVAFPLTITLEDNSKPALFKANLRMATCTTICVITDYPIVLDIDAANLPLDEDALFLYNQGMSHSPKPSDSVELLGSYWDQANQNLSLKISNKGQWQSPNLFIDGEEVVDDYFEKPTLQTEDGVLFATFNVSNWLGEADITGKHITITVTDETIATELNTVVSAAPFETAMSQKSHAYRIISMIGFALIGGLILNIMPCVLPVLGMKLNSMLSTQDLPLSRVRRSFIASALGIMTSFMILAAGISLLKIGGHAIGWGIQFQSPWFIAFLFVITLLFTINLFGLFEFQLPSSVNTWMALKGGDSYIGHFSQGMFATLLATPCSAPFLGTAVAYALGSSYIELWLIFLALSLGMSAPWLIFAIKPQLVRYLPKPGAWMHKVKTVFGFFMFLTTLWLASLLKPFIGSFATTSVITVIVISVLAWITKKQGAKVLIILLSVLTLALGSGLLIGSMTAKHWASPIVDDLNWQELDAKQIPQLVAEGKTVFVDVTADWCITCKANKVGVILQNPVYQKLQQQDLVLMKGDWTTPSKKVTAFLQSHQRYGVPFNIVYGPSHPDGIPLPVVLNSDEVMAAINQASRAISPNQEEEINE